MPDSKSEPLVHPTALIEPDVKVGAGTRIWAMTQVRAGARIGEDCNIGFGAFIDLEVEVGRACKIHTRAMLFEGARLEAEVFVGPGACLTNDRFPRAATPDGRPKGPDDWVLEGVHLERGCSLGAQAVVIAGVRVGAWAMVGSGAVVTHHVPSHALMVGVPARQLGWVCRCGVPLDTLLSCPACQRAYASVEGGLALKGV